MRLIIFAAVIVLASAFEDTVSSHIKEKRQLGVLPVGGYGLYGGYGYPGVLGAGLYPYGGVFGGGPLLVGRKRREVAEDIEEVEEDTKEKRQILAPYGLGYGLGYGGLGYGGLGYGLPLGYGLGYPGAIIGRKRREAAEEDAVKEKRQILAPYGLGYGLGYGGLGYGGLGYGLPLGYGLGYPGAIIGRKRRDVEDVTVDKTAHEKRQIGLVGGVLPYAGVGYGLGYGYGGLGYPGALPIGYNSGFGVPAIYGRKRRDVDEVAEKASHEKRQVLLPGAVGAVPVAGYGVGGVYPGGVLPVGGVYPGGILPGGVVGGVYPGVGLGVGAPPVIL